MEFRDIANQLEDYLRTSFQIAPDDPGFGRSIDVFAAGYVDSIGVIETLAHITERYGVTIPDDALLEPKFATIDGMAETIADLLAQPTPSGSSDAHRNATLADDRRA